MQTVLVCVPAPSQAHRITCRQRVCSVMAMGVISLGSSTALATPLLRCAVSYAGSTQPVEAMPTLDPYSVTSVDIQGRFSFKAVMVGNASAGQGIDYIKLYAYRQTRDRDVPIHQATYLPPFPASVKPVALTPMNFLYAGDVERELQYQCTLQEVKP